MCVWLRNSISKYGATFWNKGDRYLEIGQVLSLYLEWIQYCQLGRNFVNWTKFHIFGRWSFRKFRPRNFGQKWSISAEILSKLKMWPKSAEIVNRNGRIDRNLTKKVDSKIIENLSELFFKNLYWRLKKLSHKNAIKLDFFMVF